MYPSGETITPEPRLCSFHNFGIPKLWKGLKKSKKGSSKGVPVSLLTTFVVDMFTTAGETALTISENALLVSITCRGTFGVTVYGR